MYFKKLTIENFQSHRYTEIDFESGLNVFVGPSDSGKSAVLRALRWVLFNYPRGSEFISSKASQCRVSLQLCDGTEIIRTRGGSINRYLLRTSDGSEQVFEGFGNTVPQEITDVHNIKPLFIDQKEILLHFSPQLESPFLLFETAGNKAKTIGRISGAHLIDYAQKKVNVDRQGINIELKHLDGLAEQTKEKLKPFEHVSKLEDLYKQAKERFVTAKEKQERLEQLKKILRVYLQIQEQKKQTILILNQLKHVPTAEQLLLKLTEQSWEYHQLRKMSDRWDQVQIEMKICKDNIHRARKVPEAEVVIKKLDFLVKRVNQCNEVISKWTSVQSNRNQNDMKLQVLYHVPQIETMVHLVTNKFEKVKLFSQMQHRWKKVNQERYLVQTIRAQYGKVRSVDEKLSRLQEQIQRLFGVKMIHNRWKEVSTRLSIGRAYCLDKREDVSRLLNEWALNLRKIKKCPICSSEIDINLIEQMMIEYQGGKLYAAAGREN